MHHTGFGVRWIERDNRRQIRQRRVRIANSAARAGTAFERKDVSGLKLQRSGKGLAGGLEIFDRVNLHAAGAPDDRGGAAIIQHLIGLIALRCLRRGRVLCREFGHEASLGALRGEHAAL